MPQPDQPFIAFPSSPELRSMSRQLLHNLNTGNRTSQTELITRIMFGFTDELLKVFLLDVIHLVKLSTFMEKLIEGTVATIRSTVHGVTRAVVHRLNNQQLNPLSDYIRGLLLTAPGADGQPHPWVGFPVDAALYQRVEAVVEGMKSDQPRAQVPELVAVLSRITDLALDVYVVQPTELVRLGFVLRKMADGGASVIRRAIHALIARLIPDLDDEQLRDLATYMEHLLVLNPTREH